MSLTKTADGRFRSNFLVVSSLRLQKRVIPQTKLTSCNIYNIHWVFLRTVKIKSVCVCNYNKY